MNRLPIIVLSTLVLSIASVAYAADMPVKAVAPIPVPTWTGVYVGGNGGYGIGRNAFTQSEVYSSPALGTNVLLNETGRTAFGGPVYGGQIGFNWQVAPRWLLGLEADWQGASQKSTSNFCSPPGTLAFFGAGGNGFGYCLATEQKIRDFGTARARGGVILNDSLWYATGGFAWGTISNTYNAANSANTVIFPAALQPGPFLPASGNFSGRSTGWAAGVGVETRIYGGWTAKLEYLHVDLGGRTDLLGIPINAAFGPAFTTGGAATAATNARFTDDIIRLGLNYKLF